MVRNQRDFRTSAWTVSEFNEVRTFNANASTPDMADQISTLVADLISCGLISGTIDGVQGTGDRSFPDEWTVVNDNTDRSIDANGIIAVIGDGAATLIRDLKESGALTNRNIRDAPLRNWVTANRVEDRIISGGAGVAGMGDDLCTLIADLHTLGIINDTT